MTPAVRTVAFGDIGGLWGVAWMPDPHGPTFACLGDVDNAVPSSALLEGDGPDLDWRLVLSGKSELNIRPVGAESPATGPDGVSAGFDQLCRVDGTVLVDGTEQTIDCPGRRGARTEAPDLGRFTSVRDVSAWFEPGGGLALVALRPKKARGQESDLITASVLDPENTRPVAEPRLSTTYASDGAPARAGLELWLAEENDGEEEHETRYPRRAAGEAVGAYATATLGGLDVQARLFRWHSRGHEGAGVYLLGRRG